MKRTAAIVCANAMLLALAACDNDPAENKPKAQVTAAAPVPAATAKATSAATATADGTAAAADGATAYRFTAADSKIGFVGAKLTGKHDGSFTSFSGTIQTNGDDLAKATVTVDIDMKSLTSDQEKLTAHLKSADFFDVEKHPRARFVSTGVKPGGEGGATHTITGNLDFHGVSKSITFPAKLRVAGGAAEADAELVINRKDFGVVYPGKPDDLIKDDVLIRLTIRAKKGS